MDKNEDNDYRTYINPNTRAWNFKKGYVKFQLASNFLVILIEDKENLNSRDYETIEYVINTIIKIQYTYIRCVTVENLFIHFIYNIDEITKMYKFYNNDEAEINKKTSLMKMNSECYNYSYIQTRKMCLDLEYDYIENLHLDNGMLGSDNVWRTAIAMSVEKYIISNIELIDLKKYIENMLDIIKHRYINHISEEYTEKILKHL